MTTPLVTTKVPASTNRLEGWFGRCKPRARLMRGLKTETGTLIRRPNGPRHGLNGRTETYLSEGCL